MAKTIRKVKDSSMKMVLGEPELFVQFLQGFIKEESLQAILKNITPDDIEDISDRFLNIFAEQKDGDIVKKINLKGDTPLFVLAITEHESKVNFRASFKMLMYIVLILDAYEQEVNRDKKVTQGKNFKYPPVLPIVFYDGQDQWTAEKNFIHRTEMSDIFSKYIPKFEYELVSLQDHSFEDIAKFGNTLSLFLLMDKIRHPNELEELKNLPAEYAAQLDNLNIPAHLKELLTKVFTALLTKIDVPQEEIESIVEKMDERSISEMLTLENYSVRETRKQARTEARAEMALQVIKSLLSRGNSTEDIALILGMSPQEVEGLIFELA